MTNEHKVNDIVYEAYSINKLGIVREIVPTAMSTGRVEPFLVVEWLTGKKAGVIETSPYWHLSSMRENVESHERKAKNHRDKMESLIKLYAR